MRDEAEIYHFMSDLEERSEVQTLKHHSQTPKDLTSNEIAKMLESIKPANRLYLSLGVCGSVVLVILVTNLVTFAIMAAIGIVSVASKLTKFAPTKSFNDLLVKAQNHTIPDRYQNYAKFLKANNCSLRFGSFTLESFYLNHPEKQPQNTIADSEQPYEHGTWDNSFETFDKVYKEWFAVESDILEIVTFPMYTDMREQLTIDFHTSLAYAMEIEPESDDPYHVSHPFLQAVAALEVAWKSLRSEAKRIKDANFEPDERKRLRVSRNMLEIAFNAASSASERQIAYKRAMKELSGLITISESALFALEAKTGLKQIGKQ